MTVLQWPGDLPCSVIMGSLQTGPRGNRLATSTDTGPGKQRKRGPNMMPVSCVMKVNANQRARFDVFWEEETQSGVLPFLFRDQQIDGYRPSDDTGVPLLDENGVPLIIESWWLVQFATQNPAYSRVSGSIFQIQFGLVVLP